MKNYDDAVTYFEKALEIRKIIYGENHPEVALSYKDIGVILTAKGDMLQGMEYLIKAQELLDAAKNKE